MRGIMRLAALSAVLVAVQAFPSQSYQTEDFHTPQFKTKTPGNKPTAPGYIFLGMVDPATTDIRGAFIAANDGELVWHGPGDFGTPYHAVYNFQTQMVDNKPQLTFWNGFLESTGHGYGNVTVMDNTYQITRTICFPPSVKIVPPRPATFPGNLPNPCYIDKHESIVTDRNSIIVTAYNVTKTDLRAVGGPKNGWVYDCLFFELSLVDNSVLFQWSALEHIGIKKSHFVSSGKHPLKIGNYFRGLNSSYPWDYFHINSVQPVDGGYIVNSRMTWSFYMVNGSNGNVEWTLEGSTGGDFTMQDDIYFSWQHHPRLQKKVGDNLHIHLFNNDNIQAFPSRANVSTGYMLNVNPTAKTVSTIYNVHAQPFGPVYAPAEGSQQNLPNGHHLVGYGSRGYLEEYNGARRLIYAAQFAGFSDGTHSYRAYRSKWVGEPAYPPKTVASLASGDITMYMSWNGATEYTQWKVLAGQQKNSLSVVQSSVNKNGFETKFTFPNGDNNYQYVQVQALDAAGSKLSQSKVVQISGAT